MRLLIDLLLVATTLGTGVAAGVFTAFSSFVTQGLDRLPPADAARAMREINVTAVRPPFMLVLFGTAVLVVAVGVVALTGALGDGTWWAIVAAVIYLVGAIGVTGGANVPRNNRLAATPAAEPSALAGAWVEFRPGWQAWNHVRSLACAASCAGFVVVVLVR